MLVLNDTLISAKMARTVATLFQSIADLTFPKPRLAQMIARKTAEGTRLLAQSDYRLPCALKKEQLETARKSRSIGAIPKALSEYTGE